MVNAVMDAIALLSSLATDLDIMLNDLRASPNNRQTSNSNAHSQSPLHQRSSSTPSYTPLSRDIRSTTSSGPRTESTNHCDYLENVLRSNTSNKDKDSGHRTNLKGVENSSEVTDRKPLYESVNANHNPDQSAYHKQSSQQHCRDASNSDRNTNSNRTDIRSSRSVMPSSVSSSTSLHKVSTDITRVSKLPLYTYQHKQLQQPQTLHIKLLQQQQATKAIASQIADIDSNLNAHNVVQRNTNQLTFMSNRSGVKNRQRVCTSNTSTKTTTTNPLSTTSTLLDLQIESLLSNNGSNCVKVDKTKQICNINALSATSSPVTGSSNWQLKATTATASTSKVSSRFYRSSDSTLATSTTSTGTHNSNNNNNISNAGQHNQLKSNSSNTATTTTSTSVNGNSNNNNSSNSNSGVLHNHQRLPFCGLDSIKGSDNNGGDGSLRGSGSESGGGGVNSVGALGGKTNLCFDLNLQNGNIAPHRGNSNNIDNVSEQFHSLDATDSCGDGQFEDDMQALLPKCSRLSRDELSQSRTSLVSSSDGGILAEGETSSENSHCSDESPPCDLGLVERLLLTHPVWFLPGIQRSGAVHFLQGKEEGNFIVRGSSQHNTMAVSVRLPPDTGPYIEHYLIQSNEGVLCLESSRFKFESIPSLIAHYAQCCDELPVQLVLPRALRDAKNRQQLSSLALLGQEFWRYPMSCPKTSEQEANFLDAKSPNSMTDTSGIGTTIFSNSGSGNGPQQNGKVFSPISNITSIFSQAGTPSDTTSSLSSFTTSGGQHMQLMSPESVDSVILTMSPVDVNSQRNGMLGLNGNTSDNFNASCNSLSTFKSNAMQATQQNNFKNSTKNIMEQEIRAQRPKPPNTLNLDLRKAAPAPPMRWSKPLSPHSPQPAEVNGLNAANNFTVTTTVTFSVDNSSAPQFVEVTTPAASNALTSVINSNTTFQTFSKRLSPEGECKDTISSQGSSGGSRWQTHSSKDSNNSQRKILSPCTPTSAIGGGIGGKSRKAKSRKESKHYQESDILESPEIYCRSTLHDKISDYEDLWSHDPSDRTGLLTSFKPALDGQQGKRPDLLAETPSVTCSTNANPTTPAVTTCPPLPITADSLTMITNESTSDTQQLIKFSEDSKPRSRAGLILPGLMTQSLSEDQVFKCETTEGDTTPTAQTPVSRSKQGSPFYAEPADALKQAGLTTASILRRSQRGPLLPANHRHSEPPKGGFVRTPMCPLLVPAEIEKIAGSLDELKKKQQQTQQQAQPQQQPTKRARGRFEQWQLDSSWEFMPKGEDNDGEYGDYDSADHWQEPLTIDQQNKENSLNRQANKENKQKPLTIHQIIAKRLPDLNLPELVRCSTPPQQQQQNGHKIQNELNINKNSFESSNNNSSRLSSYDNVERNYALSQCFFNGLDSAQSDDGTVFSEPWDSSQWDSFMPQDDVTTNSDTIHFSKCRPVLSEDDTIIEELSTKDHNSQDTLKPKKTGGKHATILRNPSIRDREILCHPRNKINQYNGGPGDTVRSYTLQLASDEGTTFARNIENFISCTKESREAAPQVVMRNMRQFMNGMKNYLVKHGEGKFHQEVEAARSRLKSDEFLNLDTILETVMHQLVVLPLREHLYGMFVDYYTRSEDIQLLAQNVKYACGRSANDFGIRSSVTPPSPTSLQIISNLLLRLQEAELPLEKLELFLCVISTIFDATGCPRGQQLGADDFLPILVYVVAKCGFVGAEIEAEFMWGLLQPTLLNGEPGYYLTALCSAVHVLKSFMASENESGTGSLDWRSSSLPACSSVLRVIIPDECNGSLQTRTLPVRPHTSTREVCRIIAHKARITNPQDYALFKLVDGEETLLNDNECPQDIRLAAKGKHCMLAYKRIDAKIAWPTTAQPNFN